MTSRSVLPRADARFYISADVVVHVDWSPDQGHTFGWTVLSHGLWDIQTAPPDVVKLAQGPVSFSSVILEGGAVREALKALDKVNLLRGKRILMFSDNKPFTLVLAKLSSDHDGVYQILEDISLMAIELDFAFLVPYVPSALNLADSLSHRDMQRFKEEHNAKGFSVSSSPMSSPSSSTLC